MAALTVSLSRAGENPGNETIDAIQSLKRQIEQLDQQVRILERKAELDKDVATEKAKSSAVVSAGAGGFSIRSADTNFVLKIRGYLQADTRLYPEEPVDSAVHDTFLMRRIRPILEGTVFDRFDYRLMLDFGAQASLSSANNALVQDAYVTARLWPALQIQAGKFKEPVGLERLQSGANLLFAERGLPTQLVPNRDVGVQLQGDLAAGTLHYAVGLFNGVADNGSGDYDTADDDKDLAARLFANPLKDSGIAALRGLGIGLAGTYGNHEGGLRPYISSGAQRFFTYRSPTTAQDPSVVADGTLWRLAPQASYYLGPFGLFGEYALSSNDVLQNGGGNGAGARATLAHTAWQVSASWFLTGEDNGWKAVTPRHPFAFGGGGWGALELAARVGRLSVDEDAFPVFANPARSASRATAWAVGLNWHLNRNVKVSLDYEQTDFEGPAPNALTEEGEQVVFTRVQVSF